MTNTVPHADITSIIPIVITLGLSLSTRNVVIGLFAGVVSAMIMLVGFNPLDVMTTLVKDHLVTTLSDSYNAGVIVLLVFIGGFVTLMEKSGGGPAFALSIVRKISSTGRAQLAAWCGGIFIFYSDLGTPLIVGPVFRPLFDKLKISRQKLAFIVDSTSSPVAILVPFIGWGIYIISLIQKEFDGAGQDISALNSFIQAIPFQFYAILAIFIVPVLIYADLDFGPMAEAEKTAKRATEQTINEQNNHEIQAFSHSKARASFVFIPLLIMATVLCAILLPLGFPFEEVAGSTFRAALSSAYFFAALSLMFMMAYYGVRTLTEGIGLYLQGMGNMMQVAIVLILAWTFSGLGKELGTATYIAEQAQQGFPYWLLPAVAFVLSGIISFSTGSSWGTFAIMFPLMIPTAFAIEASLVVSIGAVLSGGLFGDHCSPISETTILSSTGSGCHQFEHFRTQLPYALTNGIIALCCFIFAGFNPQTHWIFVALAAQISVLYLIAKTQTFRLQQLK
jgi:Na+/H+ antiporter NhaC